ncbi:MAG TPA: hypothetical protein VJP45_13920 [Candidatus Limnocylindria bacterium]|nr:hypothetical protein [Candidatus Limnocylindria bacterium]
MRAPRSAVLIELDAPDTRHTWRLAGVGLLTASVVAAASAFAGASGPAVTSSTQATSAAATAPPPAWAARGSSSSAALPSRVLALPPDTADVELTAFPDWLANEPPPMRMRVSIAVRGTRGLASVDGPPTINWTEDGISYHLTSARRSVPELVGIAARLRLARS